MEIRGKVSISSILYVKVFGIFLLPRVFFFFVCNFEYEKTVVGLVERNEF